MANYSIYQSVSFPSSKAAVAGPLPVTVFGIILNTLLINAHIKDPYKILRSSSSSFIVNIAVIDLLASCANLAHSVMVLVLFESKPIGAYALAMDTVYFFPSGLCIVASLTSFLGLSIERFTSVAFPFWHRVKITPRVCRQWLALSWTVLLCFEGTVIASIVFFDIRILVRLYMARYCADSIMIVLTNLFYFGTFISLKKQRKKLYRRQDNSEANVRMIQKRLQNEQNFLYTIAIVCFIMAISVFPFVAVALMSLIRLEFYGVSNDYFSDSKTYAVTIMCLNFAINSLIYLWRWPKYRKTYKKLYCMFNW